MQVCLLIVVEQFFEQVVLATNHPAYFLTLDDGLADACEAHIVVEQLFQPLPDFGFLNAQLVVDTIEHHLEVVDVVQSPIT